MKSMKVMMTFLEDVLGTNPGDAKLHETYVASKAPDAASIEEEVAALGASEVVDKEKTWFIRDKEGRPSFWDYQIRGFLKEAIGVLKKVPGTACSKVKAHKKFVDNYVFVTPRVVPVDTHGMETGDRQRPLRASTMQGERVTLVNSETCPKGSTIEFTISCLLEDNESMKALKEALDYAQYKGLGQWRNSGCGRAVWEEVRG